MHHHKVFAAVVCLCAFVVLVSAPVSSFAGDAVPYKATGTSTGLLFVPGTFPVIGTYYGTSAGTGTHVGNATSTAVSTLIWTPSGIWFEGTGTIFAANGDEIHMETCGWTWITGDVAGLYEITGGTGRFEGATGGGTITAYLNDDGTQTSTSEGTICFKDD